MTVSRPVLIAALATLLTAGLVVLGCSHSTAPAEEHARVANETHPASNAPRRLSQPSALPQPTHSTPAAPSTNAPSQSRKAKYPHRLETLIPQAIAANQRLREVSQARILHWHGRTVWLWTNLSTEKPVARIDLITGEIVETPSFDIFSGREGETLISPSGKLLVRASHEAITALDLENNHLTAIENSVHNPAFGYSTELKSHYRMSAGSREFAIGPLLLDSIDGPAWLPDETLLVAGISDLVQGARGKARAAYFVINLRGGTVTAIPRSPGESGNVDYHVEQQLPDKAHFIVRRTMADHKDADRRESRFLFHARTGNWLPVPEGAQDLLPVNEHLVLWIKTDGGLSGSGTWIWDLRSGEATRLTPLFVSRSHGYLTYLPERDRMLAHATVGDVVHSLQKVLVVDFHSETAPTVREVPVDFHSHAFQGGRLARISTQEVDLGFTSNSSDLWTATASLPVATNPTVRRSTANR